MLDVAALDGAAAIVEEAETGAVSGVAGNAVAVDGEGAIAGAGVTGSLAVAMGAAVAPDSIVAGGNVEALEALSSAVVEVGAGAAGVGRGADGCEGATWGVIAVCGTGAVVCAGAELLEGPNKMEKISQADFGFGLRGSSGRLIFFSKRAFTLFSCS